MDKQKSFFYKIGIVLFILGICWYPVSSSAQNSKAKPPAFVGFTQMEDEGPSFVQGKRMVNDELANEIEDKLIDDLFAFDSLYASRQSEVKVDPDTYFKMAARFDKYRDYDIIPENMKSARLLLRAMLIQAECYLFGAMEIYHTEKESDRFLQYYDAGIRMLEAIVYNANPEIDFLPRYSVLFEENQWKSGEYILDKKAGAETIGVGVDTPSWDIETIIDYRRIFSYELLPYAAIEKYQIYLKSVIKSLHPRVRNKVGWSYDSLSPAYLPIEQVKTSVKARELLSEFCPWGVALYSFLKNDIRFMTKFDYSILRPFGKPKTEMTQSERLMHAGGVRNVNMLYEGVVKQNIPLHIQEEMDAMIGGPQNASGHWISKTKGVIDYNGKKYPTNWRLVQAQPTYTSWFVSPVCYNLTSSEKLSYALKAIKLFNSGLLDVVVDEVLGAYLDKINEIYGSGSPVFGVAKLLVWGNNWGLFDSELLIDGDFSAGKTFKETGKLFFSLIEEKEREMLYEGINPRLNKMGISYNNDKIPPVILRSDIFGYEDTGPYKYYKTRRIIRFFQLNPSALAHNSHDKKYDLSKENIQTLALRNTYLNKNKIVQKDVWPRLENRDSKPLGSREYIHDFTPKSQIIVLELDKEKFNRWKSKTSSPISLNVYKPGTETNPIAKKEIKSNEITIQLNNREIVDTNPQLYKDKQNWYFPKGVESEYISTEIFTQYHLKIKDDNQTFKSFNVVFFGDKDTPVTGRLDSPHPGHVSLTPVMQEDVFRFNNIRVQIEGLEVEFLGAKGKRFNETRRFEIPSDSYIKPNSVKQHGDSAEIEWDVSVAGTNTDKNDLFKGSISIRFDPTFTKILELQALDYNYRYGFADDTTTRLVLAKIPLVEKGKNYREYELKGRKYKDNIINLQIENKEPRAREGGMQIVKLLNYRASDQIIIKIKLENNN